MTIGVGVGRLFMKKGTAILVSALLFAIFYATYFVNQIPGYPFPYDYYFMLDVFAIGLVYIYRDPFEIFLPFADLMYMFQILYFPDIRPMAATAIYRSP